jgi:DNA-directed RNA polymerase subunit RPC12/RpoP
MIEIALSPAALDCILPREKVRTSAWAAEHVSTPPGSEIKGKYRPDLFPHNEEILDAFDDPSIREITFQGASRLGKTVIAQVCLAKTATLNPHPMAIADADEKSTKRVIRRTWKLFERCEPLAHKLPPERLRGSGQMQLLDCLVHGCWSGSPTTAADFAALLVVLNEVDKMSSKKSEEADFAFLMEERAKGFPRSKILRISTPALKGQSRVEAARLAGDNRARYVPCPHCGHFQTLRTGDGKTPGGLRWEKDGGKSTVALARETAWYQCAKCRKKILDHHRYEMLNAGVWVKEGQSIDRRGRITGKPARPGSHASFGPLGSHYSLLPTMSWGTIAAKFIDATLARGKEKLRNYLNSWEGVTWDPNPVKVEPGELRRRLGTDEPSKVCPEWSCFLTLAADVGRVGNELIFHWGVGAWGQRQRGRLIDRGTAVGKDEFLKIWANASYPHADKGPPLRPVRGGLDYSDGNVSNAVADICKPIPHLWPMKGSANSDFAEVYQLGYMRADVPKQVLKVKQKLQQGDLLIINTRRSQGWIDHVLTGATRPQDEGFFDLPVDLFNEDADLVDELLGDVCVEDVTPTGHPSVRWEKRGANEARDIVRYLWGLAWHYTRQGRLWAHVVRLSAAPATRPAAPPVKRTGSTRHPISRRSMARR